MPIPHPRQETGEDAIMIYLAEQRSNKNPDRIMHPSWIVSSSSGNCFSDEREKAGTLRFVEAGCESTS